MKTHTVKVSLKDGGQKIYEDVIEYKHQDGSLRIVLSHGKIVKYEADEISNTVIKENKSVTNEDLDSINS